MTATPIPRTLQTALVSLRELSVIDTPPQQRPLVRTIVMPADTGVIHSALARERARGGQAFWISLRIESLDTVVAQARACLPDARIVVAHGRMRQAALDAAMLEFAEGCFEALKGPPPQVELDLPRTIPESYVPEEHLRLDLHRRIVRAQDQQQVATLAAEIRDRFGPPPPDVDILLRTAALRGLCSRLGILRLRAGPSGIAMDFATRKAAAAMRSKLDGAAEAPAPQRVVIKGDLTDPTTRLARVEALLATFDKAGAEPRRPEQRTERDASAIATAPLSEAPSEI